MTRSPHILGQASLFEAFPPRLPRPPHNGTAGSIAAARLMAQPAKGVARSRAASVRSVVTDFVKGRREIGATNDEIRLGTGLDIPSVCSARNWLVNHGVFLITGQQRPTASGVPADVVAFNFGRST